LTLIFYMCTVDHNSPGIEGQGQRSKCGWWELKWAQFCFCRKDDQLL